jgi:hypothetical protein
MTSSPMPPPTADELLSKIRNLAANVLWSPDPDAGLAVQLAVRFRQLDRMLTLDKTDSPTEWQEA